jgi:diacylglycerol O-acyltransferase-1
MRNVDSAGASSWRQCQLLMTSSTGCRVQSAVLSGLILILIAVTGWMKIVSYAHTNADVRALIKAGMKPATPETAAKVEYPENINFRNMAYFMMAPTLCYQVR